MNTRIRILAAGPGLTLQDFGRPGYARFGLSKGGAMDSYAMAEGAILLGNKPDHTAIEIAGYGGRFTIEGEPSMLALTGAPMQATLNGTPLAWRCSFSVKSGDTLEIGSVINQQGTYGYLSIAGGFDAPLEIGASGTHLRAGLGGLTGKALCAGDLLHDNGYANEHRASVMLPTPDHLGRTTIRILWGAQSARFSQATRERMLAETFTVSHQRDRMAMRLSPQNSPEPFEALLTGLSDPVQDGEIQMTGDGVPAIVMREHQPTGGYPRIASVISADLAAAAQLATGVPFRFELVNQEQAVAALEKWRDDIAALANRASPVIRSPEELNLLDFNLITGVIYADDSNEPEQ
ncbi:MAG: biotin-dependent carboxyltransferase family protein [Granulosicoccus sp.]|nr:biotin-dependent carboxyltransferase family protein [Granulosicoccus sp.]